jgi:hypothetical protein
MTPESRSKKRQCVEDKDNEPKINRNKNVCNLYRVVNKFKKGYLLNKLPQTLTHDLTSGVMKESQ